MIYLITLDTLELGFSIIFSIDDINKLPPTKITIIEIINPIIYSILSCPKVCLLSAGREAILKPIVDAIHEDISDKLLIEPTSIEILLENIPANSLTKNKRKLEIIPTIDAKRLWPSLTLGF